MKKNTHRHGHTIGQQFWIRKTNYRVEYTGNILDILMH